jgi:ribosome biogenesis GTPase A
VATNHQDKPLKEPTKENLVQRMLESVIRKTNSTKNLRELGINALLNLPTNIGLIRSFMKALNWNEAQGEVLEGLKNTVVIVGLPNTGKSTLFNY